MPPGGGQLVGMGQVGEAACKTYPQNAQDRQGEFPIVTPDALPTQTATARFVVEGKHAHYGAPSE